VAVRVAVGMIVGMGMSVIHDRMLYYNITEVHAVARAQIGALATLIARALPGFRPQKEGCREDRVRAAPAVSRAKSEKKTHTSIQVQRKHSGLPCAMVLQLITCSPR
jgi:hypothetical protein